MASTKSSTTAGVLAANLTVAAARISSNKCSQVINYCICIYIYIYIYCLNILPGAGGLFASKLDRYTYIIYVCIYMYMYMAFIIPRCGAVVHFEPTSTCSMRVPRYWWRLWHHERGPAEILAIGSLLRGYRGISRVI